MANSGIANSYSRSASSLPRSTSNLQVSSNGSDEMGPLKSVTDDDGDEDEDEDEDDDDDDDEHELTDEMGNTRDADASSLIGISMGEPQNLMKSPTTPAVTKAQALESSMSYFGPDDVEHDIDYDQSQEDPQGEPPQDRTIKALSDTPSSPAPDKSATIAGAFTRGKRTSLVGSILGSSSQSSRQRSSSGSMIFSSIRKILPSMPSITHHTNSTSESSDAKKENSTVLGPAGPGALMHDPVTPASNGSRDDRGPSQLPPTATSERISDLRQLQTEASNSKRPNVIRRVTSDQSLYIRRAPTGASQFDDYNNFAETSEMVNSRFKAITDSLQDSSLRMPKLPSISRKDHTSTPRTTTDDVTSDNTRSNTGLSRADTLGLTNATKGTPAQINSSSRHPMIKGTLSRMSGDLIIMGGYRGSILREAQAPNRQLWVPVKVGLNLRKADLEVGLSREDELKMQETIIADGTLSHIGPVDICRRLLRKCRRSSNVKSGNLRIHDYGYDWRLSPDLLTDRLIEYLESLSCNRRDLPDGKRGAWIVAHSLGGLLIRSAVNKRPDLFAGIVYAGTPQNCVNILGPLRNGDDVLFSSRVLTAQVNFTLRTSYALLPQNGRCFINRKTGERYDLDFFDRKTWEEYRLSPCIKAPHHRQKPEKRHSILGVTASPSGSSSKGADPSTAGNKVSSRMKGENSDVSKGQSTKSTVKDTAVRAKDNIEDTAATTNPIPEGPLSPTLASTSNDPQHKPSIATQVTIPLPQATEYLSRTLSSVLKFKQSLSHKTDIQSRNAYPPAAVLFAKNTPTVYGAFVESRDAIKFDDAFDDLAFAAGDGVVLASAAQLPAGYRCVKGGRVESDRGHVGLLGDLEGVGECLGAIIDARERGVGLGKRHKSR